MFRGDWVERERLLAYWVGSALVTLSVVPFVLSHFFGTPPWPKDIWHVGWFVLTTAIFWMPGVFLMIWGHRFRVAPTALGPIAEGEPGQKRFALPDPATGSEQRPRVFIERQRLSMAIAIYAGLIIVYTALSLELMRFGHRQPSEWMWEWYQGSRWTGLAGPLMFLLGRDDACLGGFWVGSIPCFVFLFCGVFFRPRWVLPVALLVAVLWWCLVGYFPSTDF